MISNQAWKRHGCYFLGSQQYFNMPLEKSLYGCQDDWNALDHFDPTTDSRLLFSQFFHLRQVYGSLQDGFNLVQRGNWTYEIQLPGSNGTATEVGLWSISRSPIIGYQTVGGQIQDQVWMLYTNENSSKTYSFDCKGPKWISSPYVSNTQVRNLFAPYENYTLQDSLSSFNNDSQPPYYGCLPSVTMSPYGFKALVPIAEWTAPLPVITRFVPGHDSRLLANPGDSNATTINISFEFNTQMVCEGVTNAMSFNMSSSGHGGAPKVGNVQCGAAQSQNTSTIAGVSFTVWSWSATLTNVPDGVLTITLTNPPSQAGNGTGVCAVSLFKRLLY